MADDNGDQTPRRAGIGVVVAVAVASATLGFAVGSVRSGQELGTSSTTSTVEAPVQSVAPPAEPTVPAEVEPAPETTTTISFDDGIPTEAGGATVTTTGSWATNDGTAVAAEDGSQITATATEPLVVTTVVLVEPAGSSGLALAVDGDAYWQLTASDDLSELLLSEVRDGDAEQRGRLAQPLAAGTAIGLYLEGDRVGILVDGERRAFEGFFGVELDVDAAGITGSAAAVIAGPADVAFDDFAFG